MATHAAPSPGQLGTGGGGGVLFDSGCNLSGITKVVVFVSDGNYNLGQPHGKRSIMVRLVLHFNDGTDTSTLLHQGAPCKAAVQQEFKVSAGRREQINRALVWAAHEVWAVQFFTNQGRISPVMGGSPTTAMKPVEYAVSQNDLKNQHHGLVGMFGAYGCVMDRVGFRFGPTALTALLAGPYSNTILGPVAGTGKAHGGTAFDTGRNLSGVKQVVVWYGCDNNTENQNLYIYHIKLQFTNNTDTSDVVKGPKAAGERTQCFNVPAGTSITKAFVWADQERIRALQFFTDRGDLSGILGAIPTRTSTTTTTTTTPTAMATAVDTVDTWEEEDIVVLSQIAASAPPPPPATETVSTANVSDRSMLMQPVEYSGRFPGESLVGMFGAVEGMDLTGLPIIRIGFSFCETSAKK